MSKKNSCELTPKVSTSLGEEASRLYIDLLTKRGFRYPREFVNMLYADYLSSDIEEKMEAETNPNGSKKYKKNRQGQFNAKDVVEFLGFDEAYGEISHLHEEEYRFGITDAAVDGKKIDFNNAEEALHIAEDFNKAHKGLTAIVVEKIQPTKTVYNIITAEKTSKTLTYNLDVQERLQAWQLYKQAFKEAGIDLKDLPAELQSTFSAFNPFLAQQLKNLTQYALNHIYKKEALMLFYLNKNTQAVQNLINSFGSIEEAAQAMENINHGRNEYSHAQQRLLIRAVNEAQKFKGLDVEGLLQQVRTITEDIQTNSPEARIKDTLHKLNKKYGIEQNECNRINEKIKTLSDATAEAVVQLKRKLDKIKKLQGDGEEVRRLSTLLNSLMTELNTKRYYSGILQFLSEATKDIASIEEKLRTIPQDGPEKERIFGTANILQEVKSIRDRYDAIITALTLDTLIVDESATQTDIDNIKKEALNLKTFLNKEMEVVNELVEKNALDFMRYSTNGKLSEGELRDIMETAVKDASWQDRYLYSMGRASNIFIGALGAAIRRQQIERDSTLRSIRKQIDRADYKLKKAGFSSDFMYEDTEHIISNINWDLYNKKKHSVWGYYKNSMGLKGIELDLAMKEWEEKNTMEIDVDNRKERIPNEHYRKAEDFKKDWDPAQIEYYDTMLTLKGKLESLYPAEARHLYLAPQIRKNMVDALGDARNAKDVKTAIGNKIKDQYSIREDDIDYAQTGIIRGEETPFVPGNYDNTPVKEIPIYYQAKIKDGQILKDFSGAMSRVAGAAVNYAAMQEIQGLAEMFRDYVSSKKPEAIRSQSELVNNGFLRVTKKLYDWSKKNNVAEIMTGFIDQHIYNIKRSPKEDPRLAKLFDTLIKYTSFKGLAFNMPGATANGLMGIGQIFIEAGCGEFFDMEDFAWAAKQLFGKGEAAGELIELTSNNVNHKVTLLKEFFDPEQDTFSKDSHKRYFKSPFRRLLSHDCSFIGYGIGENIIHTIPMYAILHKQKVLLTLPNGTQKKISLYDALEPSEKQDGNTELKIKDGVTNLDGDPITDAFLNIVKGRIMYANQSMHGAMNPEDRGLIHQYILGRLAMNFRQWMVEHYSRRYRGTYFDFSLGDWREGFWKSLQKGLFNEDTKEVWKADHKMQAIGMFMKDLITFMFRSSVQWNNLNDTQKYNIKRVRAEMMMFVVLMGMGFALGEPDDHKKDFWRRWWIYQTKRLLTETEASMPIPQGLQSFLTIAQHPMASVNVLNSFLYVFWGMTNGDILTEIKSGPHKGENKYIRNLQKYALPLFKDIERLQTLDEDDSLFKVFDTSLGNN